MLVTDYFARIRICLHYNPGQPSALLPEIDNPADTLLKGQIHVNRNVYHGRWRF
jgi:hypothetical protein